MQKIIIDGYNVIYTDDRLRRVACKDLDRARTGLIERVVEYVRNRSIQVTVVFDGRGGIAESTVVVPRKVQIVFSPRGQSADELIVSTIRGSANPRQFIVITSDMADIGRTAKGLGCEVVGSKRFLDRLPTQTAGDGAVDAATEDSHGDTQYWLRRFAQDAESDEEG